MYIFWSFNTHNHRSDSIHAVLISFALYQCNHASYTFPARTAAYDTRNAKVTLIRVEREGIVFTP